MLNILLILIGKTISFISSTFNLGSGSTWPGHIALSVNKNFIKDIIKDAKLKTVLIAGTNGKTTTAKLITKILEENRNKVFQNEAGANLLNGIASSLIQNIDLSGRTSNDFAIFEVDENSLPLVINEFEPDFLILMNLFRDQLDRYGEVDSIAKKWKKSLSGLSKKTTLILNADDPQIAFLGMNSNQHAFYFGFDSSPNTRWNSETTDSTHCPNCNEKLNYKSINFSHLGNWECKSCGLKKPKLDLDDWKDTPPLSGLYNKYNLLASVLFAKTNNISNETIEQSLLKFKPAFGRQEEIEVNGKKVKIFLSKNPTSFNESLKAITSFARPGLAKLNLLIILNDRIPDGRDVSWIWDTNIVGIKDLRGSVSVAGDRVYDMALRLKYEDIPIETGQIYTDLKKGIRENLSNLKKGETLYILPTYSAMLEARKILTGRKIL